MHTRSLPARFLFSPAAFLLFCTFLLSACTTATVQHAGFNRPELAATEKSDERSAIEHLSVPELLRNGGDYLAQGNVALAELHFLAALKKDPDSAAACTGFGNARALAGDREKAEIAYREALRRHPDDLPARLALGRLYRQGGKMEAALAEFRQALASHPDSPGAAAEMGIVLDGLGRYEEAEKFHRQAVEKDPQSAAALSNLGFHFLLREDYAEAVAALRQALRFEPENRLARNNLAVVHVLSGDSDRALALFEKTLGAAAAWNNLGYILMTQGRREHAEKAFRRALDLNPRYYAAAKENLEKLRRLEQSVGE